MFSFGEYVEGVAYKSVDEEVMRSSATIILVFGLMAFSVGLMLKMYVLLPYIIGAMMLNFFIGVVINSKYAPSIIVAKFLTRHKPRQPIGAIQKQFAWSLGLLLTSIAFVLSILLQSNESLFETLCMFCILCNTVLYFEAVLGVMYRGVNSIFLLWIKN